MTTPARRYRLARRAVADLEEIAGFISTDSPESAFRVLGALRATFQLVADHPGVGSSLERIAPGLRMVVSQKPANRYVVFFRRDTDGGVVEIVRVLNAARDWQAVVTD